MDELVMESAEGRFEVLVPGNLVQQLIKLSASAGQGETGGILIGRYSTNLRTATVTEVTGPPSDSQWGIAWFLRGIRGLQRKLRRLWSTESTHYLGEWHSHPGGCAVPSNTDLKQMSQIAANDAYQCPEPLLLIVAGIPGSWEIRLYVFPRDENHIELKPPAIPS